jgi:Holliday junction resolvase
MLDLALEIYQENEEKMQISESELKELKSFLDSHGGKLYPIPK